MTPPVSGGTPKVSKISEAVIRFAGNSQDGIQAIGGFLARLAGRSEQEVMTFMTIPSTISGGPSIFQVRIGSGEVLSAGDEADVLVAFYPAFLRGAYRRRCAKAASCFTIPTTSSPTPNGKRTTATWPFPSPAGPLKPSAARPRTRGRTFSRWAWWPECSILNVPKLERLISERFSGKDESVVKSALSAFHAGYGYSLGDILETFQFVEAARKDPASRSS